MKIITTALSLRQCARLFCFLFVAAPFAAQAISPADPGPEPDACSSSCQRGPDPTVEYLEAPRGPFTVETIDIPGEIEGFGNGRIHYPLEAQGRMGLVVMGPGFLFRDQSSSRWWGPKLSSHGFVVVTINFNSVINQPDARANQFSNALDYVLNLAQDPSSPLYNRIDENRLGAGGWSMGGGGAMKLGLMRPLKAIMPWAPWHASVPQFEGLLAPTMIVACQYDIIAPNALFSTPMWEVIPSTTPKQFVQFSSAENHWCGNNGSLNRVVLGKLGVAWFKRFIDDDKRYDQFLCGADISQEKRVINDRDNCGKWEDSYLQ